MKFKISNQIIELNNLFKARGAKLFIVGGFVRDSLLGLTPTDIDLASNLTEEQIFSVLQNSHFKYSLGSKKLGTAIISKDDFKCEYTTFRAESYKKGGFHTPEKVCFVNDIKLDAKRRDFTINSLYYDIENQEVMDFFNGEKDLKKKQVKAIISPKYVFASDGLRILRMVRLASELDFKIDKSTYKTAKKMIGQLKDVTKDRLFKEFQLILNAGSKYNFKEVDGLNYLIKLGALPYIFPNLSQYDANGHLNALRASLYHYNNSNKDLKFEAFTIDLCLHIAKIEQIKSSIIATTILTNENTGVSIKQKHFIVNLIKAYEQSFKLKDDLVAKKFLQDHNEVLNSLFKLLNNDNNKNVYQLLEHNYQFMKVHKMPFNLKELAINGTVLKEEFKALQSNLIGKLLNKSLKFCLLDANNNTKTKILNFLKEEIQKDERI